LRGNGSDSLSRRHALSHLLVDLALVGLGLSDMGLLLGGVASRLGEGSSGDLANDVQDRLEAFLTDGLVVVDHTVSDVLHGVAESIHGRDGSTNALSNSHKTNKGLTGDLSISSGGERNIGDGVGKLLGLVVLGVGGSGVHAVR